MNECFVCVTLVRSWFLLNSHCPTTALFQEGAITQVSCCPHDEDFIAVATRLEFTPRHLMPAYSSSLILISVLLVLFTMATVGVCLWSSQGLVVVWELQLERRGRPERVSMSWEHRGHNITALCWETSTLRVFVGDSGGKVSCLRAGSSKLGKVLNQHY